MAIIHPHKALSGPMTAGDYREQDLLLQLKDGLPDSFDVFHGLGWNIGLQSAGGFEAGAAAIGFGLFMALGLLAAVVLPSSLLSYFMVKWLQLHQHARGVRAFKAGMIPLVMGLMLSAGWLLQTASNPQTDWRLLLICGVCMLLVLKTRLHLLWLMLGGAVLGALLGL